MKSSKFRFFAPVDVLEKAKDREGNEVYKVGGIISDPSTDSDGESLDPSGFDFSEFNYINWNHGKSPSDIIGEPEDWRVTDKGVYMEGYIYPDSQKGQEAVELMKVLQNSKKGNKLGWSVEGQILERDLVNEAKVTKARITAVALCPFPKNGHTFADLLKKGFDSETSYQEDSELEFAEQDEEGNILKEKSSTGEEISVDKEGNIKVTKAQTTQNSSALIKEDVEGNTKEIAKGHLMNVIKGYKQGLIEEETLEKCLNIFDCL